MTEHPARQFLVSLWGPTPGGKCCLWRMPSKLSTWFTSWDHVEDFIKNRQDEEIYTGVALAAPDSHIASYRRLKAADAYAIPGLWADIDIAGPGKKRDYPPSIQVIRDEVASLCEPTIWVHSGHGLQAWWLFDEPWVFSDIDDRFRADCLSMSWQRQLIGRFGAHGWGMDATHDLARVLRLPGTYNNKQQRVPVEVIEWNGKRYSPGALIESLPAETTVQSVQYSDMPTEYGAEITLSPEARPPRKIAALLVNSEKFALSWDHKRRDMPDQSASGYDMSLAWYAVQARWSDQEITDMLISHRRRWSLDLKLRTKYYAETIWRVR